MIDIVAHHRVETLIREVQPVCVPMLEPAPGGYTFACGVFLAHSLVVAEVYAPIVNARYFCLRPHQGRPDAQRPGAAAHLQQLPLPVKIQMGEDDQVGPLHHTATPKGILTPYPSAPQEQRQQDHCGNHEHHTKRRDMEHRKGQHGQHNGQYHRQRQKGAYHIENRV